MQRQPLQSIGNTINRPGFPIFDDFKTKSAAKPTTRLHSVVPHNPTKTQVAHPQQDFSKALYMVVLVQRRELEMATLRTSFTQLVNNCLTCKLHKATQAATDTKLASTKPSATPKKRRLDEENHTDAENTAQHDEVHRLGTPPRMRNAIANLSRASTPHNPASRRVASTPNQSRPTVATPARSSATIASNKQDRSIMEDDKVGSLEHAVPVNENGSGNTTAPTVSLAQRLEMVEASLQKLKTMGAQSNTKAVCTANASEHSAAGAMSDHHEQAAPAVSQKNDTPSSANVPAAASTPVSVESKSTSANVNVPSFAGRGSALHKPVLADHELLQAAIQRATKASIKTLLKPREALAQASELRDKLHMYQQDSAKVDAALQPSPSTAGPTDTAAQLIRLETSIVNYHHTASELFHLSPLGDQSIRGTAMSPVPLSHMSMLQDKMQSWKAKYTTKPLEMKVSE